MVGLGFPASSSEAALEFKWKSLPLPPSLLVCQVVIFPPPHTATSRNRPQTAVSAAQAALGVGAIARELLVSLVHPVMLPGGDGVRFLWKKPFSLFLKNKAQKESLIPLFFPKHSASS